MRAVNPAGIITTVAGNGGVNGQPTFGGDGGPALKAGFGAAAVVADPAGDLFISDNANSCIRRVDAGNGIITTIAGDGTFGLRGVGGPATQAHLNKPTGLSLDSAGNLYVFDDYARVVEVDPGHILHLVMGTGAPGLGGDGGPAIDAELATGAGALALDAAGDLLVTDGSNSRIREVRPGVAAPPTGCGEVITASTTLIADLGPCPGAGIIIGADHITLNLKGHRIFGVAAALSGQYPGIMISGRTGVTVEGGQVDHFSAGVAVINSTATTVDHMVVRDNNGSYDQLAFADGIVVDYSSHNNIINNEVIHNGEYDNIGLLGRLSDYNLIKGNTVTDSTGLCVGCGGGFGINILFNPFIDVNLPDRGHSRIGNQAIGNTSLRSFADGISARAFTRGEIINNVSHGAGIADPTLGIGLGVIPQGASTHDLQDLVQANTVDDNALCGIQTGPGFGSRFIGNTALGNGFLGFLTQGACFGQDLTGVGGPPCQNLWFANTYSTADGTCVGTGNHQVPPPPTVGNPVSRASSQISPKLSQLRPRARFGIPRGRAAGEQKS